MTEIATRFDYGQLDPKIGTLVAEAADRIRSHGRTAAQNVAEIGKELLAVQKALTDERRFLAWINAEFGWSKSTAYNYMNVAKQFPTVGDDLPPVDLKTLYLLAAPSTPAWVRQVARQSEGLTYSQARALIEDPAAGTVATELGLGAPTDRRKADSQDGELPASSGKDSAKPASRARPPEDEQETEKQPDDPIKEKLEKLAAWLRDGNSLLNDLGAAVGEPPGKEGTIIVKLCARHGINLEPDDRGKHLLSSIFAWSLVLHDAEEARQKAAARAAKRAVGAQP